MAKATFTPDAKTLSAFSRAGYNGEKAFAAEVELIKAHAIKGKLPAAYARAYKVGFVCARLGLAHNKANLEEAAKPEHGALWAAAANRLSRRVKAAEIKAANKAGRKRGTKMAPPKSTAEAPVAGEGKMPKTVTPAVPTLVNAAEVMAYLESKVAQMRAAQKKNAKHFTLKQVAALDAFAEAIKGE
jgi:hypothetical protein